MIFQIIANIYQFVSFTVTKLEQGPFAAVVQYKLVIGPSIAKLVVAKMGHMVVEILEQKYVPVTLCALNANAPPTMAKRPTAVNIIFAFFIRILLFKFKKLNFNVIPIFMCYFL